MNPHQERLIILVGTALVLLAIGMVLWYQPCANANVRILGANFESADVLVLSLENTGERALDLVILTTAFGNVQDRGGVQVSAGQRASQLVASGPIDQIEVRDRFCPNVHAELAGSAVTSEPSL